MAMKLSPYHLITKVIIMFNINDETPVSHVYKLNQTHSEYYNLKLIKNNRKVTSNTQNVKRLAKSMQDNNLLYAAPIIVQRTNDKKNKEILEIIDGQHRYLAAKSLNLPIYIHILKNARYGEHEKNLMSTLNSNQKNWGLEDFAYHYSVCEDDEIVTKYSEYLDIYNNLFNGPNGSGITHGILICITQNRTTRTGNNIEFKQGKLNWNYFIKEDLYKIHGIFNKIKRSTSQPSLTKRTLRKQQFQSAILTALKNECFDYNLFLKNLHIFPNNFNKLSKKVDMLSEIYKIEAYGSLSSVKI
tara:strand:+ start:701 stop:1600 length:900 start_codon:yes stop_codon:yes gene_type:complete